jgi:hypothetical protein
MQQTFRTSYPSSDFTSSPPRFDSHLKNRFQSRQNPTTSYNRLIKNSEFYDRPLYDEFLSSSINFKPSNSRLESDFIHSTSLPRTVDVSNDYRVPINQETLSNCKSSF